MKIEHVMRRQVVVLDEAESIVRAQQLMLWNELRYLPIVRAGESVPVGVLSQIDVLRAYGQRSEDPGVLTRAVREFMSAPALWLPPDAELIDAAGTMSEYGVGCLPIVEGETLVGLLTAGDALRALTSVSEAAPDASAQDTSVASIMFPEPIAVHAEDSLLMTALRMARTRVRHACVVDAEGRVTGIVSDRDVRSLIGDPRLSLEAGRPVGRIQQISVREAMTPGPRTIGQSEPISRALQLLATLSIGALPVVDARDHLRGIVSYVDVLSHLVKHPLNEPDDRMRTQVSSIMTRDVEGVVEGTPLERVHALFAERAVHHLPVVEGEQLVGLIAWSDLLRARADPTRPLEPSLRDLRARHLMQGRANIITVGASASVREAAAMLCEGHFHCLPVVDADDRLLGILTSTDLIRFLLELLEAMAG